MSKDSLQVEYKGTTIGVGSIVQEHTTTRQYMVSSITHASEVGNVMGKTYLLGVGLFKTGPDRPNQEDSSNPCYMPTKLFLTQLKVVQPQGKELIDFLEGKVDECLDIRDEEMFKMYSSLLVEAKSNMKK